MSCNHKWTPTHTRGSPFGDLKVNVWDDTWRFSSHLVMSFGISCTNYLYIGICNLDYSVCIPIGARYVFIIHFEFLNSRSNLMMLIQLIICEPRNIQLARNVLHGRANTTTPKKLLKFPPLRPRRNSIYQQNPRQYEERGPKKLVICVQTCRCSNGEPLLLARRQS